MEEDYVVRYGGETPVGRSDYMTEKEASKFYAKLDLSTSITWKELLHEPLEDLEVQEVIRYECVKVMDLGIGKIAVPERSRL